jgi:RNA-binding protein
MQELANSLPGFQRKYLRGLAHPMKPAVMVGSAGLSEAVHAAVDAALNDHELIVVKLHQPTEKKAILYRAHPVKPKIELPARASS